MLESSGPGWARPASWLIGSIPAGFGQPWLAHPLYTRWLATGPERRGKARLRGGARAALDLRDRIQGMTFLTRDYEPALVRFISSRLAAGSVFVDVGAHVGLVSLSVAARRRAAGIRVHAFEPDPANADSLRRNLELNPDLDVTLHQLAVGAAEGTVTLRRHPRGSRERACAWVESSPTGTANDQVAVKVVPLGSYLEHLGVDEVGVMKIDVEGYEPMVIEGAEPLLRAGRVKCIVCEVNARRLLDRGSSKAELVARIESLGYRSVPIPSLGLRRIIPRPEDKIWDEDIAFQYEPAARSALSR